MKGTILGKALGALKALMNGIFSLLKLALKLAKDTLFNKPNNINNNSRDDSSTGSENENTAEQTNQKTANEAEESKGLGTGEGGDKEEEDEKESEFSKKLQKFFENLLGKKGDENLIDKALNLFSSLKPTDKEKKDLGTALDKANKTDSKEQTPENLLSSLSNAIKDGSKEKDQNNLTRVTDELDEMSKGGKQSSTKDNQTESPYKAGMDEVMKELNKNPALKESLGKVNLAKPSDVKTEADKEKLPNVTNKEAQQVI
ncbi:MAG: hypothetical protein ACJAW3_000976 [Lentimonas sp.]|jgi:hypothetical protein